MPEICQASDVVVLTSDNEGTPLSLIEAQAAGVPVVATDVGGVRSVLPPGSERAISPDDVHGFAEAVVQLLRDRDLRRRTGVIGQAYVLEHFGFQQFLDRAEQLYADVLSSDRNA